MNHPDDLATLVDAYLDQTLTDDQCFRLESMLASSAAARAEFWTMARIHGQIHEACAAQTGGGIAASSPAIDRRRLAGPRVAESRSTRRIGRAVAIAAAIAVVGVGAALLVTMLRAREADRTDERSGPPVAVLMAIDGTAIQSDGSSGGDLAVGEAVRRGAFSIGEGRVELAFDDGSSVAITGPASFRIDGPDRAVLASGRLSASAKSGFTVVTPRMRVVDLGTAFSVVIDDAGATRVQVFRGRVRVEPIDGGDIAQAIEIDAWRSLRLDADGGVVHGLARAVDAASVPSDDAMDRLVAWYRFDGDATNAAHGSFDAAKVSHVRFVEGRTSGAAEFDGSFESWIDLPINATPEAMPRMTWGAWVNPAALEGQNREVLSTDEGGYRRALTLDPRTGAHGAASDEGRPHAAAFGGSAGVVASESPAVEADQWRFIAAVYDAAAGTVSVYSDDPATGRLVRTGATGVALKGGRTVIRVGNHVNTGHEAFSGLIDEAFIFADALSAEQIEAIRSGRIRPDDGPPSTREATDRITPR